MFKKNSTRRQIFPRSGGGKYRFRRFFWLLLPVIMPVMSGCHTVPRLPPVNLSEDGWKIHQGQAVWRSKKDAPELAGELLVAVNPDGRSFVQFTKTPLPFFVAQTTSNSWQFEVVPQHKIYSYRGPPPASLLWPNLPASITGMPAPKKWELERLADGHFRFQNPSTGESLEGYLNP
jgi:hypothetical protein